jgi:NADPH-dependent 2,4-dienoyl-CoA reductase/sulfur reductase-like enzyme
MRRVVVIGGGPAGMTAARVAAAHGVSVVLIDAGAKLGGQYHRQDALAPGDRFHSGAAADRAPAVSPPIETGGRAASRASADRTASEPIAGGGSGAEAANRDPAGSTRGSVLPEGIEHVANAAVWAIEPVDGGHRVHLRIGPADDPSRRGRTIDTRALVIATGSYDRALPFPGWDLPGVVTAGAAYRPVPAAGRGLAHPRGRAGGGGRRGERADDPLAGEPARGARGLVENA